MLAQVKLRVIRREAGQLCINVTSETLIKRTRLKVERVQSRVRAPAANRERLRAVHELATQALKAHRGIDPQDVH